MTCRCHLSLVAGLRAIAVRRCGPELFIFVLRRLADMTCRGPVAKPFVIGSEVMRGIAIEQSGGRGLRPGQL